MGNGLIELAAGDYGLAVDPRRGGSVVRLEWGRMPLFRPAQPGSILNVGCFPLVPFCNRISHGAFRLGGRVSQIDPNLPDSDHPHPMHGFGWQSEWSPTSVTKTKARIVHRHASGAWPLPYEAVQEFSVSPHSVTLSLSATNLGISPMPCGLGFHPYFIREADTVYHGLHQGEWSTSVDGLPIEINEAPTPKDWWNGAPIGTRSVDTVYEGRAGPIRLTWPRRPLTLELLPSADLSCTAVYAPRGASFFCVEPMSHPTDAINRNPGAIRLLAPGETMTVSLEIQVVP